MSGTIAFTTPARKKSSKSSASVLSESEGRGESMQPAASCNSSSRMLVIIDPGVEEYQTLVNGTVDGADVVVLDGDRDGIEQITEILHQYSASSISHPAFFSLHLVSHGSSGRLDLGNSQLSLETIDRYAWDLQSWFSAFSSPHATPTLLIYGCNVAQGDRGKAFIHQLQLFTGAAIAASETRTGHSDLGGNWNLEVTTSPITLQLPFESTILSTYRGTLAGSDSFASRTVLNGTNVSDTGSNVGSTGEAGEPNHAGVSGGTTGTNGTSGPLNSVWWSWTAPFSGSTIINTVGSSYDTTLAVYTGSAVNSLTQVAANDDFSGLGGPSQVSFVATAGTTYQIAVDGYSANTGSIVLNIDGAENSPPIANGDSFNIVEGSTVNLPSPGLLSNDSDANGHSLTINSMSLVSGSFSFWGWSTNGSFSYGPPTDYNGTTTFSYTISDGFTTSAPATVTVNVLPVNDAPTFVAGASQTATAGSGAQTISGWATGFSPGPANEAGQTVQAYEIVSNSNPEIFALPLSINTAGDLTYTPANNLTSSTTATIGVRVRDNGGTANGGIDTSSIQTFTITIDPTVVNIQALDASADESGPDTGTYRISRSTTGGDLTVNLTLGGSASANDYTLSGGSASVSGSNATVTIPDGQSFVDVTLTPNDDVQAEAAETLRLDLATGAYTIDSAATNATVTIAPNDFVVTNTNDSGEGSLRQAILNANAIPGGNTITFAIPTTDPGYNAGTGAFTINLLSGLPTLTETVTIDGRSQPGFAGTPIIELNGASAGSGINGLVLGAGSDGSTIQGLVINRFTSNGILVQSNTNIIRGNFIGTDVSGTVAQGNAGRGISLGGSGNIIGGLTAVDRNLISGNAVHGIYGVATSGNTIQGNYIGTDVTGSLDLGNGFDGVVLEISPNNTVGGTTAAERNVIAGNDRFGVTLFTNTTTGNQVQGNFIGIGADGTTAIGNTQGGVFIGNNASGNTIGGGVAGSGNTIAHNGAAGVIVSGTGNRIQGNSIYSNTGLGIDLGPAGVTPNDLGDGDTGANNLQNFPVLIGASSDGTNTYFAGRLNSAANTTFQLEFFSNAGDPEGQTLIHTTSVTTDANGNATFTITIPTAIAVNQLITATATDPGNNTSEFSAGVPVIATVPVLGVVINEISWMGTQADANSEWIELHNPTGSAIDLSNWVLTDGDDITIPLSGIIPAGGYFLLERTDNSTVNDITADLIYTGSLLNAGETLRLRANDGREIDVVNGDGGAWAAGTNTSTTGRFTMERIDPTVAGIDTNWRSNDGLTINGRDAGGNLIYGTPKAANSLGAIPTLSISDTTVTEGASGTVNASFTITLSHPTSQPVTVNYATANGTASTADGDYVGVTATPITFNPGETSKTIAVTVNGDTKFETNETFFVNLSNPTNATIADGQGIGTITNDDAQPIVSINPLSITRNEGADGATTAYTFTVSLTNPSAQVITVNYSSANGTAIAGEDYTANSGTLTFNPGDPLTQTITIAVTDDTIFENDETFTVTLNSANNATVSPTNNTATGTITNDDPIPTVSISPATVTNEEGIDGTVDYTFTVSLSNPSDRPITVTYSTSDGTALAGEDYAASSGTLTFNPGDPLTQTITISVNSDNIFEDDENFAVTLNSATDATISTTNGTATGIITNDDPIPTVSISPALVSQDEGNDGTTAYTFTVSLSNPSDRPITVVYGTTDGTALAGEDYVANGGTLVFTPDGSLSQTITVLVKGDNTFEPNEEFSITLNNATNATIDPSNSIATGVLINDDPRPTISIEDISTTEGDSGITNATFTVTLSNPSAETITVQYVTTNGTATVANGDYTSTGGILTFNPGETSTTFDVAITGDTTREADETFNVLLINPTNATIADDTATATIVNDDGVPVASITPATVTKVEGNSGTTAYVYTVRLTNPNDQPVSIRYSTNDGTAKASDGDYIDNDGVLTFNPGDPLTKTITVLTKGDAKFEADETFTVQLNSATNGVIRTGENVATGTLTNDDRPPTVSFSTEQQFGKEGDTLQLTAELSAVAGVDVTVPITLTGTATNGTDYTIASNSITIAAGQSSASVAVKLLNDAVMELDETVVIKMGTPTNATASGVTTQTITIDETLSSAVIVSITPDVRETSVDSITIQFSEEIKNFELSNLTLTIDGQVLSLDGTTLTTEDNIVWTLGNLASITTLDGSYQLMLSAGNIADLAGNPIAAGTNSTWLVGHTGEAMPAIRFQGGQKGITSRGSNGSEFLRGNWKNDVLLGLGGNDTLTSGTGKPKFGKDRLYGGDGDDSLLGGRGFDLLDGGKGNDTLDGGHNRDLLLGGDGNDRLLGKKGHDILVGGKGRDSLTGGSGKDMFVFNSLKDGIDVITDFNPVDDLIDLRKIFANPIYAAENRFAQYYNYVQLGQTSKGTAVQIDTDGSGDGTQFTTIAILKNRSVDTITSRNFVVG